MEIVYLGRGVPRGRVEVPANTLSSDLSLQHGSISGAGSHEWDLGRSSCSSASMRSSVLPASMREQYTKSPMKKRTAPRIYHIIGFLNGAGTTTS